MSLKQIDIYTDGACSGNPGPGGWGAYFIHQDKEKKISGYELETTNNRMELMAAIKALEYLKFKCKVNLYTDSTYVKNGITSWIHNWLKNNWRTSNKKVVKNADLWQGLYKACQNHEIEWHWVKGHSNVKGNEVADELAVVACGEAKKKLKDK